MKTPQSNSPKFYDVEQIADCIDVSTRTRMLNNLAHWLATRPVLCPSNSKRQ